MSAPESQTSADEALSSLMGAVISSPEYARLVSAPRDWKAVQAAIDDYLEGYELRLDEGCHPTTEFERFLLVDAIAGLMEDDDFINALNPHGTAAPAAGDAQTNAARDVLAERQRQISDEGWERERDDTYKHGELAAAAASYAQCAGLQGEGATTENAFKTPFVENWPWSEPWWKPSSEPRRNLVKAGALILAEIERLDRAAIAAQQGKGGEA